MSFLEKGIFLSAVLLFGYGYNAHSLSTAARDSIQKNLQAHKAKASFSYRNGSLEWNVNGSTQLLPASVAKMVSTACSLRALGPQFQFQTEFLMSGSLKGDVLEGDLIIKGSGDPSFMIEDLREVLSKLRHLKNIREIKGHIVFDVSYFGARELSFAEGFQGDDGRAFTAPLMATPINANAFSVWISPDPRGSGLRTQSFPFGSLDLIIDNQAKLDQKLGSTQASLNFAPQSNKATISGRVGASAEPRAWYRGVQDPYTYFSNQIRNLWKEMGGVIAEKNFLVENTSRSNTRLLWKHESRPLSKTLMDINKYSLNFASEMVWLAAGVQQEPGVATQQKSRNLLSRCFQDLGVQKDALVFENASGLSRTTRIQASGLTQFLESMKRDLYFPEYLSSLSVMGVDGTGRTRLTQRAGQARIKTGSLRNVRSVAGYTRTSSGDWASFALMLNDSAISGSESAESLVLDLLTR